MSMLKFGICSKKCSLLLAPVKHCSRKIMALLFYAISSSAKLKGN
ncbi:hypothetical protein GNIT_3557 [Glaciecola nitratireducens FR1064]|uniref:Uncharacterized protein n=1 Tax=Glaciecola nitratireducens (strain JCM 12485 / KCTC 12276 / FR1064) TaxID=1085623 RepID=G4QNU2_GLANF|nr:hypothetical protein GNIT_3557 [Glaciecola nitratireducens FR1064]